MNRITFDFETRSASDLKKQGAYKYSLNETSRPTCLAAKLSGNKKVWFLRFEEINRPWDELDNLFQVFWKSSIKAGFEFSAHNAFFERCIYNNILVGRYGWPIIPEKLWRCTAAKAAACALPRNLQDAGEAMALSVQKDRRGYSAVMATCKPTKKWVAWKKAQIDWDAGKRMSPKRADMCFEKEPPLFLEYKDNPEVWETLYEYCKIDVLAEEKLDESLPDLVPQEQELWFLNQKLNWRGLKIDISTVEKIVKLMAKESEGKLKELDALTMGLVTKPGARQSILDFLAIEGIELPDIKAKTVSDALDGFALSEDARRLLEIRKALSMTSTKKYQAFLNRANDDGRVRDIVLFHGASTGRDTGTGIQPHNFPRGLIRINKDRPYAAVENIIECDEEMLHILYGPNLSLLFSSVLRNMIVPSEGHELFVADFSKVEVAVLWWLADNTPGLKILASGRDPYIYQAAVNMGKTYEEIEKGVLAEEQWALDARQLGKAQILGCGFNMGPPKFQDTAWSQYRLKLTIKQSIAAVKSYREGNPRVPEIWKEYENAAINAVESGKPVSAGKCRFFTEFGFLWIVLPSGRKLAYKKPSIVWRVREYDVIEPVLDDDGNSIFDRNGDEKVNVRRVQTQPKKTLEFWAVSSKTKKWGQERTFGGTITENIVQAVARDLMMHASYRLENAGYKFLLSVHDEGITEKKIGEGSVEEFTKIMCTRPPWAGKSLPIDAKGWKGPRYRK